MEYEAEGSPSEDSNLDYQNKLSWFFDSTEPDNILFTYLVGSYADTVHIHVSFFKGFVAATIRNNKRYADFEA